MKQKFFAINSTEGRHVYIPADRLIRIETASGKVGLVTVFFESQPQQILGEPHFGGLMAYVVSLNTALGQETEVAGKLFEMLRGDNVDLIGLHVGSIGITQVHF